MDTELRELRIRLDDQAREITRLKSRQRWIAFACLAGLCLIGAAPGQDAAVPDCITAKKFAVVDATGRERAIWAAVDLKDDKPGGAYLLFISDTSGAQIALGTNGGNPSLSLNGDHFKDGRQSHAMIGVDGPRGPFVSLWGQNKDAYTAGLDTTVRGCEMRVPWDDNTHCLILKKGDEQQWAVP